MKYILPFMLIVLFTSCSIKKSDDAGFFGGFTSPSTVNEDMKKFNNDFYAIYLNTKSNKSLNKVFQEFGDDLDENGIVFNIDTQKKSEKLNYLDQVQKELNTSYRDTDAPFIIFYKNSKNKQLKPYKIIAFGESSNRCISHALSQIRQSVASGTIEQDMNNLLYIGEMSICRGSELVDVNIRENIYEINRIYKISLS